MVSSVMVVTVMSPLRVQQSCSQILCTMSSAGNNFLFQNISSLAFFDPFAHVFLFSFALLAVMMERPRPSLSTELKKIVGQSRSSTPRRLKKLPLDVVLLFLMVPVRRRHLNSVRCVTFC